MSLRPNELTEVVEELQHELRGAVVQKAHAPLPGLCYLELRVPGQSVVLCISARPGGGRLSVAESRPATEGDPETFQRPLRHHLIGTRLEQAVALAGGRTALLRWARADLSFLLMLELGSPPGQLLLCNGEGRIIAVTHQRHALPLDRRPGQSVSHLERADESSLGSPSPQALAPERRLQPRTNEALTLLRGADRLLAEKEQRGQAEANRKRLTGPLKAKLSRLKRTVEKVRAEADRTPEAEEHRAVGELLTSNLHLVTRGAASVTVIEYTDQGPRARELPLDPRLAGRAQVERHFHQYRRLLRGSEHAKRRLLELETEEAKVRAQLLELENLSVDALDHRPPPPPVSGPSVAKPFKEYRTAKGERIWVGKGAAKNDQLTFKLARPHDLWLHARGVPGAHVVIPLERKGEVAEETLLDAAHLALFHSELKGEAAGDVSYTPVRYVRRQKGGAPGQVLYTQEKTVHLRIELARLERLLKSVEV